MSDELKRGLEGVLVAESDLSYVDGEVGKLVYRGYDIEDLARGASYEEVLYLLWRGSLPTREELDAFTADLAAERAVDDDALDAVRTLADAGERPMAALRTAVSMLSAYEPESDADPEDLDATLRQGRRITAKIPTLLAAFERARQGEDPVAPDPDLSHAANFLYMLTGTEPDDVSAETFDMALTLHADHGLNASTFTAIVIGSTMADVYSGVTGGIGALSGPLHGGANQDVMEVLQEVDASDKDPVQWVKDAREEGRRIPGFGHRVYKVKDPRAKILEEKLRDLSESSGDTKWLDYTTAIEEYLTEQGLLDKGIAPNVDFYSGSVYDSLGIPVDMYTPIFAMSRAGGWIAHMVEYQEDNRLIRPRARYTGPKASEFVPVDER
ncbi:citrate synthase [Halorubrum lacusprofundi]|jgi:citrate synthase|uniref:Citrate synthase n=1 Tax=Halorubrum lacusprofundi (strain ATCC 49239 / DSM 5036 / JCM 8891 / ACAM 34) TaxID=416348 RepID=B9LUG8_HALLT|nr:citrate synthase [Halorubrum lacusprofundi]ACM56325.1 2-methylcitrate synthase/citrate synthase II [Halorubrum lacusprofundi ATCC 49239]MCG1005367.1 citrate synthase [Halorubrum lacusprofundi]